ncbi:MAG: TlpA family protein disulfide reductase [Bacteroidales bacterium]|nr:TlpA family protein disulfide reductase [Bacteroidales bacterium]
MKTLSKALLFLFIFLGSHLKSQQIQDFTLTSVDSVEYNLYSYLNSGTPVVIDFFARYCSFCSDEMPYVDTLYMNYGSGQNLQVWAIETSGYNDSIVLGYKEEHGVSFPFFSSDTNPLILDILAVPYTPYYYFICVDGSYRHVEFGSVNSYIEDCLMANQIKEIESNEVILSYKNDRLEIRSKQFYSNALIQFVGLDGRLLLNEKFNIEKGNTYVPIYLPQGAWVAKFQLVQDVVLSKIFVIN